MEEGKARDIGGGYKIFYHVLDRKRNGVGVILKKYARNVVEVKQESDRFMCVKVEIEGEMLIAVSGYTPQAGCELKEKEKFWNGLDGVMESIPRCKRLVLGADFNGHVGVGTRIDKEVMGRIGVKDRNLEGRC